jgi:hypothetical protein
MTATGQVCCGWENARIAELAPDWHTAQKVSRHGADETHHAELIQELAHGRAPAQRPLPTELDYMAKLQRAGLGVPPHAWKRTNPWAMRN